MRNRVLTSNTSSRDRFLSALILGAVLGLFMGIFVKMFLTPIRSIPEQMRFASQKKLEKTVPMSKGNFDFPNDHPTIIYIKAYQNDDWEKVVEQTLWIRERLRTVWEETKSYEKLEEVKRSIINEISNRDVNFNCLKKNGVEDKYLFTKDAKVLPIAWEKEADFHDPRVKEKVWFSIEYLKPSLALRNEKQFPIKSLVVALCVNSDGYIVKSSIIGNAEIVLDSIKLWEISKGD
ncbi:MAG: hypothetical protein N3G21_02285 [Candidatus Hydrogenedentes bacterium]|nr:hypothetical protein [Candidatus Hydrogenedentota bacterium]